MTNSLRIHSVGGSSNRDIVEGLGMALHKNYASILQAAGTEWERRFAGKDPSDACVSVRVSSWGRVLSGRSVETRSPLSSLQAA